MEDKKMEKEEVQDSDFSFVQQDASLHDVKFETKPTTYFKDAMKRFVKSKSAVVAGVILLLLIATSIIVPYADKNDIDKPLAAAKYLPPKWFSNDMGGFLDGTRRVDNAVLDPDTEQLPSDSDYVSDAIVGDITVTSSYADVASDAVLKYGKGGALSLSNTGETNNGIFTAQDEGILSPEVELDLTSNSVTYAANLDENNQTVYENTSLKAGLGFYAFLEENKDATMVPLGEEVEVTSETSAISCSDVSKAVSAYYAENNLEKPSSLSGQFAILVKAPKDVEDSANKLLVKSVESSISSVAWNNATKALSASRSGSEGCYSTYNALSLGISQSEVLYGSFRYDYYQAAFGERLYTFTKADIDAFEERGWIEPYSWKKASGKANQIVLTEEGEIYCPLQYAVREVYTENVLDPTMPATQELVGYRSLYRELYYEGRIASCKMPKYIFGTDSNGKDFFKVVFSGLLTSLGLGFLASAINIVIGLIWGSISGYFGGWVDMVMERVTEILGGVPFIIVMTLIALLANKGQSGGTTFWIFLLALCLTGWMGIAGTTRSQFYRYKGREYVLASRTLGASDARLIFKHILPNAIGTIVTSAVLMVPSVIFTEANVSYLLPGALALSNSFGVTLNNVQADINMYPYLIVSASIIMALLMICFNLFGNGLRDAFNPSLKGADD